VDEVDETEYEVVESRFVDHGLCVDVVDEHVFELFQGGLGKQSRINHINNFII